MFIFFPQINLLPPRRLYQLYKSWSKSAPLFIVTHWALGAPAVKNDLMPVCKHLNLLLIYCTWANFSGIKSKIAANSFIEQLHIDRVHQQKWAQQLWGGKKTQKETAASSLFQQRFAGAPCLLSASIDRILLLNLCILFKLSIKDVQMLHIPSCYNHFTLTLLSPWILLLL